MGLDIIELQLEIEDKFGISLDDEFWQNAGTFGDVVDSVFQRLQNSPAAAFENQTYSTVLAELQEELENILPGQESYGENIKLTRLIPFWKRRRIWDTLRQRFKTLPSEEAFYNKRIIEVLTFEPWIFFPTVIIFAAAELLPESSFKILLILLAMMGGAAFCAILPYGLLLLFLLPSRRIGDLAKMIFRKNDHLKKMSVSKEECAESLKVIFCHVLGVKLNTLQPHTTLDKDLAIE
jgi:hypothetical protein